jgi:hypothetical protein
VTHKLNLQYGLLQFYRIASTNSKYGLIPIKGALWLILSYLECIHIVYEGHLGMYSLGGALLTTGLILANHMYSQ